MSLTLDALGTTDCSLLHGRARRGELFVRHSYPGTSRASIVATMGMPFRRWSVPNAFMEQPAVQMRGIVMMKVFGPTPHGSAPWPLG
jgi:hypothetical protein